MATYDQTMRLQASARVYQQRYDDALQPWDLRAPAPVLGEDINEYRAKLAILAKHQLPPRPSAPQSPIPATGLRHL